MSRNITFRCPLPGLFTVVASNFTAHPETSTERSKVAELVVRMTKVHITLSIDAQLLGKIEDNIQGNSRSQKICTAAKKGLAIFTKKEDEGLKTPSQTASFAKR